jgi:hypothetical protein
MVVEESVGDAAEPKLSMALTGAARREYYRNNKVKTQPLYNE